MDQLGGGVEQEILHHLNQREKITFTVELEILSTQETLNKFPKTHNTKITLLGQHHLLVNQ